MENPLLMKLRRFADLSPEEANVIESLTSAPSTRAETGAEIIRQGDKPHTVTLILTGLACRFKISNEGDRQIVGVMVPGDLCDLHAFVLNAMDHSIGALSPVTLTHIPRDKLLHVFDSEPRITRALWWSTLVDEGTLREWVLNIATRSSYQRLAHLLSEICMRLHTVGLATATACEIKMRQVDLADAVGLGRTHVNPALARLQNEGLVDLGRGYIAVKNIKGLMKAGEFNEDYLHLHREVEPPE